MTAEGFVALAVALVTILTTARLLGVLARRLGQPPVIGEILGGILLGPTLADGAVTRALFPLEVRPAMTVLADVGICVFMVFVGLHVDRGLLRGHGRIMSTISISAVVVPFLAGVLLASVLADRHADGGGLVFTLFMGAALACTAFPVLARILRDRDLLDTPIGGLALACAALDDVLIWSLLAVVAAIAGAGTDPARVLLVVPMVVVLLTVVRPLTKRWLRRHPMDGILPGCLLFVFLAAGATACSLATDWMGLHLIFGAFMFGVAMPEGGAAFLRERVLPKVERGTETLLIPVFFASAGIGVDLSTVDLVGLGEFGLILLAAVGGKGIGGYVGARICGVRRRHSAVLSILLNTRGLTELILLNVGVQIGVLDADLYSLMVVMALVTTAMTGALLRVVYPPAVACLDRRGAGRVGDNPAEHDRARS
ncbi:cation:proton antiporter [Amycolatopsis sp. NPDC057786]|uniref:cation:proton antiporter n=1 Tax=Amycolatopsis sp. NPDC057786 TaxID=3346250 RepID=UPI00367239C8